jgi:hypothetical protein
VARATSAAKSAANGATRHTGRAIDPSSDCGKKASEVVMMSIEDSAYYGLNAVGSDLWEALESPVSITSLCQRVIKNFDIDAKSCELDVMELLTDLRERKLVQFAG